MRTRHMTLPWAAMALALFAAPVFAQGAAPAAATGVKKEVLAQIEDAERKMVALAEATPQEKFSYRPATGVRSTSEVFMHVTGANFLLPQFAGVTRERGVTLNRDSEKTVTDKAQVVDLLKKSFAYAKQAVMDVPDAQMDAAVTMFGQQTTKRGVLVSIATHAHEHLGQSIAYARVNGIVPPWSGGGSQ
ncbi:MAG TPA: DinB family protein [Gemmatimonadaceae bacterium]|nr:DinB family protein [Gemmatimonadaceae bacterium]